MLNVQLIAFFTQEIAQPVQQNMENVLKDFVNARTAGKAPLVNRKVTHTDNGH